jgi:MFS family permease
VVGNPALRRVLVAFLAFNAAEYGTWVAMLLYAYEASGPAAVGVVALAQLLPAAAFAPVSASLADRYPRDRVLLVGYVVQAVAYALTAAGMVLGAEPLLVYVAGAALAAAITFTRPAQGALLPSLAHTPEELTAANSVAGTVEGVGVLLGPLLAAGILVVGGPGEVMAAGALATAASGALVVGLRRAHAAADPHPHADAVPEAPGVAADEEGRPTGEDGRPTEKGRPRAVDPGALVRGGLRAISQAGHARVIIALLGIRMLTSGALDVLFVLLALEVFETGEAGAGILTAALGLGTVLGGAASLSLIGRQRLSPAIALSAATWAVPLVLVGILAPAGAAPFLVAIGGIGFAAIDVTGRTLLQRVTPDRLLARVLGALEAIGLVFLAIGSVAVPVLAGWVGVELALVAVALAIPVAVAVMWVSLVHIDDHAHVPVRQLAVLRRNAIFAPLPAPQLEAVARRTRWISIDAGATLIREGEPGDRYYALESGSLRVTIDGALVRTLDEPGDGMGEIALLRGVPRTATVVATAPCVLLALDRADFLAAVTGHEDAHRLAHREADERASTMPERSLGTDRP